MQTATWTWSKETTWNIFRVNTDGSNLVQLTDGPWNDFDPCFLPNGRIAFISERPERATRMQAVEEKRHPKNLLIAGHCACAYR